MVSSPLACLSCGGSSLSKDMLGYYVCDLCGMQSQDYVEETVDADQVMALAGSRGFMRRDRKLTAKGSKQEKGQGNAQARMDTIKEEEEDGWQFPDWTPLGGVYVEALRIMLRQQCEAIVMRKGCKEEILTIADDLWTGVVLMSGIHEKNFEEMALQRRLRSREGEEGAGDRQAEDANDDSWESVREEDEVEEQEQGERDDDAKGGDEDTRGLDEQAVGVEPGQRQEIEGKETVGKCTESGLELMVLPAPTTRSSISAKQTERIVLLEARKALPVGAILSVLFLACHVSETAILPNDICRWALGGEIPYLIAFSKLPLRIRERISFSYLAPMTVMNSRRLEYIAACLAMKTCLVPRPVNVSAIAARFLAWLDMPGHLLADIEKMRRRLSGSDEWFYITPERSREYPSRVPVMALVMLAIRKAGFHRVFWESHKHGGGPEDAKKLPRSPGMKRKVSGKERGKDTEWDGFGQVFRDIEQPSSRTLKSPSCKGSYVRRPLIAVEDKWQLLSLPSTQWEMERMHDSDRASPSLAGDWDDQLSGRLSTMRLQQNDENDGNEEMNLDQHYRRSRDCQNLTGREKRPIEDLLDYLKFIHHYVLADKKPMAGLQVAVTTSKKIFEAAVRKPRAEMDRSTPEDVNCTEREPILSYDDNTRSKRTESLCVRKGVPDIEVFLGRSPTDPSRPRTCATLKKPNLGFPLADKVTKPFQELLYVAAQLIEVSPQKLYSVTVGIEKDLNSGGQNEGEGHKEQNLVRLCWRGSADDHSDADVEADAEREPGAKEANKATEFRVKQEEDVDEGGGLEAINTQNSFAYFR